MKHSMNQFNGGHDRNDPRNKKVSDQAWCAMFCDRAAQLHRSRWPQIVFNSFVLALVFTTLVFTGP